VKPRDRAFRLLMKMPRDTLRRIAGVPIVVEGQTLDVQTQIMLGAMRRLRVVQPEVVEVARQQMDADREAVEIEAPEMAMERDILVPGPGGTMRARVYGPKTSRGTPGMLVYFHGGGFVTGSIISHDAPLKLLAHESGVIIAAIDYRLGPEAKFPAAIDDALAAYTWARAHADDFGASRARVGVGGDSAGGNMSAVVCHLARDAHIEPPTHQLLLYPAIDWSRSCASHRTFANGFFLEEARTFWYENHYLNRIEERDDPRASPIRFRDFSGLTPATIVTAGFDILRDEGRMYADALERAKVTVDFCCETSLIHGFFNMSGVIDAARAACTRVAARVHDALA
jgi:acetyl esterase